MTPPQWELTEDEINEISTEFQRVGGNNTAGHELDHANTIILKNA